MYQAVSVLANSRESQMELSDAHCHLTLFEHPEAVISESVGYGITTMIASGGSAKDNADVAAIAKGRNVFGVVGISPDFIKDWNGKEAIASIIRSNKNIVGIGEVGLDFKITADPEEIALQKKVFGQQVELSAEMDVPLAVHSRFAMREVMEILKSHSAAHVMFHFFEGNADDALQAEKAGYLISVPPTESKKRSKAIAVVGMGSILAETDSPVVGKTPMDVEKSIGIIAKARGASASEVAAATTKNLKEFFYI